MANKVITITPPTAASAGLTVMLKRDSGGTFSGTVEYVSQGVFSGTGLTGADIASIAAELTTAINDLLTIANPKMGF